MELKHPGSIGRREFCEVSDEELMDIIRSAATDLRMTPLEVIKLDPQPVYDKPPYQLTPPVR